MINRVLKEIMSWDKCIVFLTYFAFWQFFFPAYYAQYFAQSLTI